MHRVDEDRYRYKRFRKGSEPVEAWWLDPHPYYNSKYWRGYYDHRYDRYPIPPHSGWAENDFWNHGDREAPWRKERGYWQNGKWIPIDVANHITEKVGKEMEQLKGAMNKTQIDLQLKLNEMKKIAADADRERNEGLASIENIKKRMANI